MGISFTYDFPGAGTKQASGAQGTSIQGDSIPMSSIFGGRNVFVPGSSFIVQEIVTIVSALYDPKLVRTEDRWFTPKQYIGTYQRLGADTIPWSGEGDTGLIRGLIHKMTRYNTWTVGLDPNRQAQQGNQGVVDSCNFFLGAGVVLLPGTSIPTVGYGIAQPELTQFVTRQGITAPPLIDRDYIPYFGGFGLYFYPGACGVRVEFDFSIINVVYDDSPDWVTPECGTPTVACDIQFRNFILGINGNYDIDNPAGIRFSSVENLTAAGFNRFYPSDWNEPPCEPIRYYTGYNE